MSFDWSAYLSLARELARIGATHASREAESRFAISRAYYAAFCKTRNFFIINDGTNFSLGPEVHTEVKNKLLTSRNRRERTIGENLNRLRRLRNKADYDDQFRRIQNDTQFAIELAEDILADLERL